MTTVERHEFQTEARQLLNLMIHSVYSHKEIFLRELISNASDALDKLRYESLTRDDLGGLADDPHIRIEADEEVRTLTVHDSGIGMNHDELIEYLGTIAKSGSGEFLKLLQEARRNNELPPELIGQFGVGFYASFMVADKVTVLTRRAGEHPAWRWESTGDGAYTIEEAEREAPGTSVILHLKDVSEEEGIEDYTAEYVIRRIVSRYSDFVAYPIRMQIERTEVPRDENGKPLEGAEPEKTIEDQTLNSMKAIWARPESEVADEEYNEFYKHISHDWSDPLSHLTIRAEGTSEFRALLYIPSRAPFDLFMPDGEHGIHLYIRRVFIMNDCKDLIPRHLRFVRGVVDSEDLNLNISREILQQSRQIRIIRNRIIAKVLDHLREMQTKDAEKYETFWQQFGKVLKEGLIQPDDHRDRLLELLRLPSTHDAQKPTTLGEYLDRMPPDQEAIYYLTGESRRAVENSPHLEAFRERGIEVLLLTDPVDDVWVQSIHEYKEKPLRSAAKGEVELGSEEEKKQAEERRKEEAPAYEGLLTALRDKLSDHIKEVRLSSRLKSSPACLVGDQMDLTPQLEQLLKASGQEVPTTKRILELNPDHPIVSKLKVVHDLNPQDARIGEYAELLHGQAVLAEGGQVPDPGAFSRRLAELMQQHLGVESSAGG